MSRATLVVEVSQDATETLIAGQPYASVAAQVPAPEPVPVTLLASQASPAGQWLAQRKTGESILISGALALEPDTGVPQVFVQVATEATPNQYLCEVVLVGRLSGDVREAPKSVSRSLAVNGFDRDKKEPTTDWYQFRGYNSLKERLAKAEKGSLCSVAGSLGCRTNKEGNPYYEVTARSFQVHRKGGQGTYNPAAGKNAVGYAQADFSDDMPSDWND